jgi:hypothetical protein
MLMLRAAPRCPVDTSAAQWLMHVREWRLMLKSLARLGCARLCDVGAGILAHQSSGAYGETPKTRAFLDRLVRTAQAIVRYCRSVL